MSASATRLWVAWALACLACAGRESAPQPVPAAARPAAQTPAPDARYLIWAAREGDSALVQRLLGSGAKVNATADEDEYSALSAAAERGDDAVVSILLANGANPRHEEARGFTPLHLAASKGHVAVARLLLDHGALLEQRSKLGATPLFGAALDGQLEVAALLLARGAEVDARDAEDKTPLFFAVAGRRQPMVAFLLDHGADINAGDRAEDTPLHVALEYGTAGVEMLLERGADPDVLNERGFAPLHLAAVAGDDSVVEVLLSHRANASFLTAHGYVAAQLAATAGSFEKLLAAMPDGRDKVRPYGVANSELDALRPTLVQCAVTASTASVHTLALSLQFRADGQMSRFAVVPAPDTVSDSKAIACVKRALSGLRLPRCSGSTELRFTFDFAEQGSILPVNEPVSSSG